MIDFEKQYLDIIKDVLDNGIDRPDRTDVGSSRAAWHQSMKVDLGKGFPIITTRKVALRIAFEETWFFLRGETDTKKLEAKKINIWKGNTTREFLDKRELFHLPEGHMGMGYSWQWRNFGGEYDYFVDPISFESTTVYDGFNKDMLGVDQVFNLIKGLKNDPNGRRHIITAWNPLQLNQSALPPCHVYQQYQVLNGHLNSAYLMRSADAIFGLPYNQMSYALLNLAFSEHLGLKPGILGYTGEDVHIYANQIDIAKLQVEREPFPLPSLEIHKKLKTFDDILNLEFSDIELIDYVAHPDFKEKPKMAV